MNEHGYTRTWQQCQRKIKSLKLIYRKAKDNNHRSGRARVTCPFFEELDRVLGDKPSFVPGDGDVLDTASLVDQDSVSGDMDDIQANEEPTTSNPRSDDGQGEEQDVSAHAQRDRAGAGSRKKKKTKLEATVESFAKVLSDNLSKEWQLAMQMQAAQNEHEARMFGMMVQAITSAQHGPAIPLQGHMYMPFPTQQSHLHPSQVANTYSPGPLGHSPQPTYLPHTSSSGRHYSLDEDQENHTFTQL
nr:uncharacterized protein LOC129434467 [Misgurnus anguillicaudatus]